jgi:quercetin dioxygenase-like cupin family protein
MKAIPYTSVAPTLIDNDQAKRVAARVVLGKADGANNFCMRVFEIGAGGHTPLHRHAWEHEMFFHAGQGEVLIAGTRNPVKTGCVVLVPGEAEHQIRNVGEEPLVVVCLVPGSAPEL